MQYGAVLRGQFSSKSLQKVPQRAYMILFTSGLYGYLYICEIYVNLIWYLYYVE